MKPHDVKTMARCSQSLRKYSGVLAALSFCALSAHAQTDQMLPPTGGPGGGQYTARCAAREILTGFDLRTGDDVDAIKPLCMAVRGPSEAGPIDPYPSQFGGNGGGPRRLVCPGNTPLVVGMAVLAEGVQTLIVNNIHLFCGPALANQKPAANPTVVFDGPSAHHAAAVILQETGNTVQRTGSDRAQICPDGLVAVGINGRSGVWLDAVGLICGALPEAARPAQPANITPGNVGKPPVSLGRVKSADSRIAERAGSHAAVDTAIAAQEPLQDDPPICASARSARARNSPAAPGLEKQCAFARTHAAPAAASPEPPAVPADGAGNRAFAPPVFNDGARLWACADAAEAQANDGACAGLKAGKAYCRMQGFSDVQPGADGSLGVTVKRAQAGTKVRAIDGDACAANDCTAISELVCAP